MSYDPALSAMHRKQEIMDKEAKMKAPKRTVPKNSVALIISREPGLEGEEAYLDLQVLPAEEGDDGYLTSIANLAANLLEQSMFGEDDDDEEELELDSAFFGTIDLGED
jgi:hypothetical protein